MNRNHQMMQLRQQQQVMGPNGGNLGYQTMQQQQQKMSMMNNSNIGNGQMKQTQQQLMNEGIKSGPSNQYEMPK